MNNPGSSQQHEADAEEASGPVFGRRAGDSESLGAFDPGMPPTAFEGLLASCGIGIAVLTADDALVEILRQVSGGHPSVVVVDEWAKLIETLDAGYGGIVLLDMDRVGLTLEKALTELERRAEPPVVVAASSYNDAPELMRALTARRIHRLLLKPASPGKARLLLGAAINRITQLREQPAAESAAARGMASRGTALLATGRGRMLATAMGLVFGVVAIVGIVSMTPRGTQPVDEPEPAALHGEEVFVEPLPVVEPVVEVDPFAEQLERADRAFAAGWLVEPADDNALDGYSAILAEQPDHPLALEGLEATITLLFTWTESALLGGALDLATVMLDHVRRVRPASSRLAFLDAQLERALASEAEAEQARAQSEAAAQQPREIDRLLGIAERRLQRGQLVQPPGDNALAYFRQAAALGAADRAVVAMRVKLAAALIASVRQLLDDGHTGQAESLIGEARQLGADPAVLAELDARLVETRDARQREHQASLLTMGLERLRDGQLLTPESDSAAHYLASLRTEDPAYPELQEAWQSLITTLVTNLQAAVADGDWSGAEVWLAGLGQVGADAGLVAPLTRELRFARTQERLLDAPAAAEELTLIRSRPPVYPDNALRNGIEGWVEVDFIVGRDGRPRDVTVVAAEPHGTFDRAATHAVSRYQFEPFALEGEVYERRARLMIRFAMN